MSVAIDCEMVGSGNRSLLARVSIVNSNCEVLYDTYVKPTAPVTDYRTSKSGIQEGHLVNAKEFGQVQTEVIKLINGKILVGYALKFDLDALGLSHPEANQRDFEKYKPLQNERQPQSLKALAEKHLGKNIQVGQHSSVEDAQTVMELYKKFPNNWQ